MEARAVHHVAMAVESIDEAVETYRRLFGAEVEHRETIEAQGVEAAYLRIGRGRVEIVAPLAKDSTVGRFLEKRGPGMHHVAFEVPDVRTAIAQLEEEGANVIDPEPRPGLAGHEVFFVHPESVHGVLVEVISNG